MKHLSVLVMATILFAGCHQLNKTKSGLAYKITKGSSTTLLKNGQFIKFNIEFKLGTKDSILNTSYGHIPAFARYDTAQLGKYNFMEILPSCGVGDKVEFSLSNDSLKAMGMIPDFNKSFPKGGIVKGRFEILAAFDNEKTVGDDYKKEADAEKEREVKALEAYMAKKGIKGIKTPNGAFVEITTPGDMTNKADSGKQVSVLYNGYTEDGKVFDSNIDKPGPAFKVIIGAHSVIPGWDEGLRFFGKGSKGKILVPAMLGYGQQGAGAAIKPYTNLIFDVQVADVTVAPPPAPAAPTPNPAMGNK